MTEKKKSRMFPFITESKFNPLGGECKHHCYWNDCWAKQLIRRMKMRKYYGEPRIVEHELKRTFKPSDFVFVCDMCDLMGDWVPAYMIEQIVNYANRSPAQFLFLTKNPKRYKDFCFDSNCTLGATIETDNDLTLCGAPSRSGRIEAMKFLDFPNKMLSIEPIMKFTPNFVEDIVTIRPDFVAVGMDNYNLQLPEPKLLTTEALILALESAGIKVYRKTLRKAWDE